MSTEALTVFVDNKLNKLIDYYSYQIIRRIIFNNKNSDSKKYIKDILGLPNPLVLTKDGKYLVDTYKNIYDENGNNIGFNDWIETVLF
tara:strand:+ start:127 stop:390 length:264 start_codon:yes stop_codon:yes gene_type:complete